MQTPEHSGYCLTAHLEKLLARQVAPSHAPEITGPSAAGPVTLEDVKKAVEKLKAVGAKVSTGTVHAELGRGSKTTICKHYAALKLSAEAATPSVPTPLSPVLLAEIAREVDKMVKARTSQLSEELDDVQKALAAVVAESEGFRAAASEAESRAAALELSVAEQAGHVEELRSRSDSLSTQLNESGQQAERARQSLALSEERLRMSEERVARLEVAIARNKVELADARVACATVRDQLDAATRECISLQLKAESGTQAAASLEKALAEKAELQSELVEARSRLAGSEAQRQGLSERLQDAQAARVRVEATCEQLLQKVLQDENALSPMPRSSFHEGEGKGPSDGPHVP